jgi:hypothetical protein
MARPEWAIHQSGFDRRGGRRGLRSPWSKSHAFISFLVFLLNYPAVFLGPLLTGFDE